MPPNISFYPSFSTGFAHNASESKDPGFWRGLIGLWLPVLGPTGRTLFDVSGFNSDHGTLTNMDVATDWITTDRGFALNFDGTNDHIIIGTNDKFNYLKYNNKLTFIVWARTSDATGTTNRPLISRNDPSGFGFVIAKRRSNHGSDANKFHVFFAHSGGTSVNLVSDNTINDGLWHQFIVTINWQTSEVFLFIDMVKQTATGDLSGLTQSSLTVNEFLFIGKENDADGFWLGDIQFVSIHRRILNLAEISMNYF